MVLESILQDPVIGTPNVTCQMADPSCASTPRTMSAIDGSTSTSRVPSVVFTFGRMSGCASMPRASPMTGMIVARVMPLLATDACVSCLSRGFQPLLELSADRVNQGSMVVCAAEVSVRPRRSVTINRKRWQGFICPLPRRAGTCWPSDLIPARPYTCNVPTADKPDHPRGWKRMSGAAVPYGTSRADIAGAARVLEAADRLGEEVLRQPQHDLGEKDRRRDRRKR